MNHQTQTTHCCSRWTAILKVSLLTCLVLGSFIMITIGWRHIEVTDKSQQVIVGALILIFMYTLMIFECVNRSLAALIGAALSLAASNCLIEYSTMEQVLEWEDLETLSLLFGMMIIVNVLSSTGLFDYLAIWSYHKSNGHFWLLVSLLALTTGILSAFIDNVSTMLLMTPTLIKLSELQQVSPQYLLMIMCVASNIGGTATPIGDPPNLIIIGDQLVNTLQISFSQFCLYCSPCVLLSLLAMLCYLKLMYPRRENFKTQPSPGHQQLDSQHTTQNSKDSSSSLSSSDSASGPGEQPKSVVVVADRSLMSIQQQSNKHESSDELDKSSSQLVQSHLGTSLSSVAAAAAVSSRQTQIEHLLSEYKIKDWTTLAQCLVVLMGAVILFFLQSFPQFHLTLGWISLFAGLILLTLNSSSKENQSNKDGAEDNFDRVINEVEWSTLIFFFALFIVMEAMSKLGLITFLGQQVVQLIDLIPAGSARSIGAICIILWSSAIASAFIDNVPFTSMMVKVLGTILTQAQSAGSDIQLKPLVFALAFGSCFGGNGSLIGASANLVTAGLSKRYGHPITFVQFFKFCMPITVISLIVANIYLVVVFVVI